jgi:hypothetical protein
VARQRARRRAHRSLASGRSGAPKLAGGAQNGEGSEWNSARVSLELGRHWGGRAIAVQNGEAVALGERAAQARREGNRSGERCGDTRLGSSPFIGGRGSAGEGSPGG